MGVEQHTHAHGMTFAGEKAMESWWIENLATMACMTAVICGAYALGAGHHAWWGLLFMLNINYVKS